MSQEYNDEFRRNPLAFFRNHPVVPPSDLGQKLENLSVLVDERTIGPDVEYTNTKFVSSATTDPTDRIRWIDFKETRSLNEPGALTFSGARKKEDAPAGAVPIYFLPWRSMHLVSMTIPELSGRDYDAPVERNPNIFFTAAINGCSVFVRGRPTAPEVYHAGIDGTLRREAAQFWRECLEKAVTGRGSGGGVQREVNKSHYTKDKDYEGPERTRLAGEYKRWLEDQHRNQLTITEIAPWGCVFGIRYGRLWSFYLQENATVTTLEFVKKRSVQNPKAQWPVTRGTNLPVEKRKGTGKFLGLINYEKTVYAARRTTTRPMRVSDFYPGGEGRYTSRPLFTRM